METNISIIGVMASSKKPKLDPVKPSLRRDRVERKNISGYISAELRDAFDALIAKTRRGVVAELSLAIEQHLAKEGFWPWPPPSSGSA